MANEIKCKGKVRESELRRGLSKFQIPTEQGEGLAENTLLVNELSPSCMSLGCSSERIRKSEVTLGRQQ